MNTKEKMDQTEIDELEKQMEEKVTKAVTVGTTILIQAAIIFALTIVVLKFVWAWVVPDLFPGAVAQGLINADLTWSVTMKLAIFVAVLTGVHDAFDEAFKKQN